jgi:hypothetical protein
MRREISRVRRPRYLGCDSPQAARAAAAVTAMLRSKADQLDGERFITFERAAA